MYSVVKNKIRIIRTVENRYFTAMDITTVISCVTLRIILANSRKAIIICGVRLDLGMSLKNEKPEKSKDIAFCAVLGVPRAVRPTAVFYLIQGIAEIINHSKFFCRLVIYCR